MCMCITKMSTWDKNVHMGHMVTKIKRGHEVSGDKIRGSIMVLLILCSLLIRMQSHAVLAASVAFPLS